jgi:hypothetical protein
VLLERLVAVWRRAANQPQRFFGDCHGIVARRRALAAASASSKLKQRDPRLSHCVAQAAWVI